jgi:eukaryotic-like serine/threonine-protein kinase
MRTVLTLVNKPAEAPERGGVRLRRQAAAEDNYFLGDLIGRGGMADVWAAERCRDGRQVAVKLLRKGIPAMGERVEREAEVLRRLPQGYAPQLVAYGRSESGTSCLVMERLMGQDLFRFLLRRGAPPLNDAMAIVTRVACVLDALHDRGIIHRDLKPSNVFLCRSSSGVLDLRVLDYGIALVPGRSVEPRLAQGTFVGSPGYLAPEQVSEARAEIGPHTDVFGLAALAYRLFTGIPAFACRSAAEAAFQAMYVEPAPASGVRQGLPSGLDPVLARGLAKDPEVRPARATDLAAELLEALATA